MIGIGLTIAAWAWAHDLHLIGVEPRHFTEYHWQLLPLSNPALLALQYAVIATLGPGMVFGAAAFVVCRLGVRPRLSPVIAWLSLLPFVAMIEAASRLMGTIARERRLAGLAPPYSEAFYPDETAGIAYTQSANITAYAAAVAAGTLYLAALWWLRCRRTGAARPCADDFALPPAARFPKE